MNAPRRRVRSPSPAIIIPTRLGPADSRLVQTTNLDPLEHRSAGFLLPRKPKEPRNASGDDQHRPTAQAVAGLCRPAMLGILHGGRPRGVGPAIRPAGRAAR